MWATLIVKYSDGLSAVLPKQGLSGGFWLEADINEHRISAL
jgi:hypothetical protein